MGTFQYISNHFETWRFWYNIYNKIHHIDSGVIEFTFDECNDELKILYLIWAQIAC